MPATCVEVVNELFDKYIVRQALHMARCELEFLLDLDADHYQRHQHKAVWYYGQTDGWVTEHHVADIMDTLPASHHVHCSEVLGETKTCH